MTTFTEVQIVGAHFRGDHAKNFVREMKPGDELDLVRELDNQYDGNAIKAMTIGDSPWQVGYVAAGTAAWLAPEMDAGVKYRFKMERMETAQTTRKTQYPTGVAYPVQLMPIEELANHPQDEANGW